MILANLCAGSLAIAQDGPRLEAHPLACHHEAPRQDNELWREDIERLAAWLAKAGHRDAVRRDPAFIASYHALAADKGGPISRNMRWHPHLVRPEASGTAWEVPFSRVNSAAVPVFTPVELRKAPADRGATLLEFVPLANGGAANARVREEWLASSARGRPPLLALADVLGADALVVDGFVELLPTADKPPFRRAEVIELSRRQIAEELRLAAPERAGPHRFLGFEALAGFDAKAGLRDAPESVRRLDGASVVMVGRMVPVDEVVAMSQFLLSQDEWGDDWGRPPTLADVVLVQAPATGRIDCARAAVRVHGTLRVKEQREDGELVGIYRLEAERVELVE